MRLAGLVLLLSLCALGARGSTLYTVSDDGCSGGCGPSPYELIQLDQIAPNEVQITVSLNPVEGGFVNTGAGEAFEFNILNDPAISISNLTAGFSAGPAPAHASAFGAFDYSISCTACGPGGSNPQPGPLSFDVAVTSGILTIGDFIPNAKGYLFASDILGSTGNTGNVGAGPPDAPTPEPATWMLMGAALAGFGYVRTQRRESH